jgi:hypothetical protein
MKKWVIILLTALACVMLLQLANCSSKQKLTNEVTKVNTDYRNIMKYDSIYLHDSVLLDERRVNDTIYITKQTVKYRYKYGVKHDSVVRVDTIPIVIERDRAVTLKKIEESKTSLCRAKKALTLYRSLLLAVVVLLVVAYRGKIAVAVRYLVKNCRP